MQIIYLKTSALMPESDLKLSIPLKECHAALFTAAVTGQIAIPALST